jgi:hypothetical protein
MADSNGVEEQNQDDVTDQNQENEQQDETSSGNEDQNQADAANEGEADDEVVITIGEEAPPHDEEEKAAPAWVKDLRKADREKAREIRELKQQLAEKTTTQAVSVLGVKPTLEGCDFDTDRFETELTGWHERKRAADEQAAKQQKATEDAQKAWQTKLDGYKTAKASLKVSDFEDAEAVVLESTNVTQQGIIVSGADTPANVIYALGKNPAKLKELASIKDPVKFAFAVAKLETQLKVTPRKAPPAPEKVVRGSAAAVGVTDPKLERLEAEAARTGDRTKIAAYRREIREKQQA